MSSLIKLFPSRLMNFGRIAVTSRFAAERAMLLGVRESGHCITEHHKNHKKTGVKSPKSTFLPCCQREIDSGRLQSTMSTFEDPRLRHLFDGNSAFNVYNKSVINMSVGAPGPDLLRNCEEMMLKATQHRMAEEQAEGMHYLFQYGASPGLWECRDELKKFLSRRYGDPVERERLILTCGATHGLQLLLTSILAPNGVIFVEEVTYMIALDVFRQFPLLKVVTVPMKNDIVDLDRMEEIVERVKKENQPFLVNDEKNFWAIFYTIPTYHNPTGRCLPEDSCKKLVDIARRQSLAVVCDDVYNLLHYGEGTPPHRLFYYDRETDENYQGGNIISNGSFSKILSPAIRLGWLECPPRVANVLRRTGILRSGGAVNHYVSGVIASLLHLNMEDRYLDLLVTTYKTRLATVCDALNQFLPEGCSYFKPQGGYFLWIHLPQECNASEFVTWCSENFKVTVIPGTIFSYHNQANRFLRVSIAFHENENLKLGVEKLCEALKIFITNINQ